MNYVSLFFVSFTLALSGALMPGPLLTTVIAESTKHGFKTGPLICIGHAILEALMIGLIIAGLARFVHNQAVMLVITLAGSAILFYFGLSMLFSLPKLAVSPDGNKAKSSNLILLGVTVSISNPYWSIWWLTIGLGLVLAAANLGFLAVVIFFLGHSAADFGWYSIVSGLVSIGRKIITGKVYKGILLVCALALIAFSISFVARTLFAPRITSPAAYR